MTVPRRRAAATEERLRRSGAVAVSLLPAESTDAAVLEPDPGASPLWEAVRIEALLALDCDLSALRGLGGDTDFVADRDWSQTWRQGVGPMRFGRLRILPKDYPATPTCADSRTRLRVRGRATIRLDPGLAFGTGTHPTTALCLGWLGRCRLAARGVLDVGCGSGILGIAAARLGAEPVVAVDHDAQAREATSTNARHNGVHLTVLDDLARVEGDFDIAVANIVANTLCEMAPVLAARASTLVLSGVLAGQVDEVVDAYRGVRFHPPEISDGWAMLVGERRG